MKTVHSSGGAQRMTHNPIAIGSDGLYHPASEEDVIALVDYARAEGLNIRARGATHSVAWSIYTDPLDKTPPNRTLEQTPPPTGINIAFDKMRALEWISEEDGIIEAEPGINLGHDPLEPFGVSTLENSLLYQIFEKGWAIDTLGGITHQTLAGFGATGSAGGSTQHSWDNTIAYRIVDGTGKAEWIDRDHPHWPAVGTSMGLIGLVTRVRMKLVPMYNIEGSEVTTPLSGPDAKMQFLDGGPDGLGEYFKKTEYSRVVWWPQKGVERIQTWEARRVPFDKGDPDKKYNGQHPYLQFPPNYAGQTEMLLGALVFTLFGNTNPIRIIGIMWRKACAYLDCLGRVLRDHGKGGIGDFFTFFKGVLTAVGVFLIGSLAGFFTGLVRMAFPKLLPAFNPMTDAKHPPTEFNDWYWRSLCMDNTVSDDLLGTEFTEVWVPIGRTEQVIDLYKQMFDEGGYHSTGYFSTEVYAGAPTDQWMHPGFSDGADEYAEGTLRVDVYWYRENEGIPNCDEAFLDQFWEKLYDAKIPFRLHWGKFVPRYDFERWAKHYRDNLPHFEQFMDVRKERDPDGVFFTDYWQRRLTGQG